METGAGTGGRLHLYLKPAEQTPLTALEMAKWLPEVGLPEGVVNIITGFGESRGAPLVQHADVNKIAFTGSAAVGKIIVKQAADTVKRVTLELGGKSPNIFFDDADFEAAIDGALFGVFINQGEVCSAGSRILVQKSIYRKFVEAMVREGQEASRSGARHSTATQRWARWSAASSYERVRSYQEIGKHRGEARTPAAAAPTGGDLDRRPTMSSRLSSTTSTTPPASLAKKFSAQWLPSFRSRTRKTH